MANDKTRREEKREQKKKRKERRVKVEKRTILTDNHPYQVTPSYERHNGRVSAMFKLYVRPGTNRNLTFQDVIDLVPLATIPGVDIYFISKDGILKGVDKSEIIAKNSNRAKTALESAEKHEKKKKKATKSMAVSRASKVEDYNDYELMKDSAEPIVFFKWNLMIVADREIDVENQLEKINTLLDQNHEGLAWDAMPGEQQYEYRNLFNRIYPNVHDHTSTGSNYSGLFVALSRGLSDPGGHPIGIDALSITQSTAFFNFDKSTKKQAFILAPRNSVVPRYVDESGKSPSMSSLMAQSAANHIMMSPKRHRVHHIVLNDFDYFEQKRFFAPAETKEVFDRYDVSQMTINPLQGFGELKDVTSVFNRLTSKLANIFEILLKFEVSTEERGIIMEAIKNFYVGQNYWTNDADIAPEKTLIVNIKHPQRYATMGALLSTFTNISTLAQTKNRMAKADKSDSLRSILESAATNYMGILGRPTSITPSKAPQVYYDFKKIDSLQLKQVQLVNIIEYVIYTARPGDCIIFHGYDTILSRVSLMLLEAIQAAQSKGIRFIFAFDEVQSPEAILGSRNDIFQMQKFYYNDLDTDVDWSMIGKVLPSELDLIETALNQDLGPMVRAYLQSKAPNQMMVHRRAGNVNNFIRVNPLI